MLPFLAVVKVLYQETHKLAHLFSCTFLRTGNEAEQGAGKDTVLPGPSTSRAPHSYGGRETGGGFWEGQGLSLWILLGPSLPTSKTFHVLKMPWLTCPLFSWYSLILFLLKNPLVLKKGIPAHTAAKELCGAEARSRIPLLTTYMPRGHEDRCRAHPPTDHWLWEELLPRSTASILTIHHPLVSGQGQAQRILSLW